MSADFEHFSFAVAWVAFREESLFHKMRAARDFIAAKQMLLAACRFATGETESGPCRNDLRPYIFRVGSAGDAGARVGRELRLGKVRARRMLDGAYHDLPVSTWEKGTVFLSPAALQISGFSDSPYGTTCFPESPTTWVELHMGDVRSLFAPDFTLMNFSGLWRPIPHNDVEPPEGGRPLAELDRSLPALPPVFQLDLRDDLIDRCLRGVLTPQQAEEEAARAGLRPLAWAPDPSEFDPLAEPWWTLGMAIAWIVWRTPHAVRLAWPDYRREKREWAGPKTMNLPRAIGDDSPVDDNAPAGFKRITGYVLQFGFKPSVCDVLLAALHRFGELGDVKTEGIAARDSLWQRLRSGDLKAEGVPNGELKRVTIRDAEWIDLTFDVSDRTPHDAVHHPAARDPAYLSVRVRAKDVRTLWPAAATMLVKPDGPRGKRTAVSQAIDALWPNGIPSALAAAERDRQIVAWLKKEKLATSVDSVTIRRVLKERG